ncbi:MAG: hypothetical protein WBA17_14555 [Saprospiraceae bacterium]
MNNTSKLDIVLAEWIYLLLNNTYNQGTFFLTSKGSYCVVGVLAKCTVLKFSLIEEQFWFNKQQHSYLMYNIKIPPSVLYKISTYNDLGYPFKFLAYWLMYYKKYKTTNHDFSDIKWFLDIKEDIEEYLI